MGCYDSKPETKKDTDHKTKKKESLSDLGWERLNREIKVLKAVTQSNQTEKFDKSRQQIKEYYGQIICKAQKGYQCNYLNVGARCNYCGFMHFSDDDLRSFDDFASDHIRKSQQLHVQLIGPDNTPYNRKYYQLIINIPNDYPQQNPTFYFGSEVYHINVNQETNRILFEKITRKGWKSNYRLLQIIVEIVKIMSEPDQTKNYFPNIDQNVAIYNQFIKNNLDYLSSVIEHTDLQANLAAPWRDSGEPLHYIDMLQLQQLVNINPDDDEYAFVIFDDKPKRNDDSIARSKEKKMREDQASKNGSKIIEEQSEHLEQGGSGVQQKPLKSSLIEDESDSDALQIKS